MQPNTRASKDAAVKPAIKPKIIRDARKIGFVRGADRFLPSPWATHTNCDVRTVLQGFKKFKMFEFPLATKPLVISPA